MKNDDFSEFIDDVNEVLDNVSQCTVKSGKNRRSEIEAYGYRFDSNEELDFFEWLLEAKNFGFVDDFTYQPEPFVLFDGVKNQKGKLIIREHVYTADFKIIFNDKWINFISSNKIKTFNKFDMKTVFVDIKGVFNKFGGDRGFSINQKWVFSKFDVYVWKIVPKKFFKLTWLPKKCMFTKKTHKKSTKYGNLKLFENHDFKN